MTAGAVFEFARARGVGIFVSAILGGLTQFDGSVAEAAPITVAPAFDILDVRSANTAGFGTGPRIFFGDNVVVPNGLAGTTGSAVRTNLSMVAFQGGTQFVVAPNTQVTILPSSAATGDDVGLNQIHGLLTHTVVNPSVPQPDRYRVQTPVATVRPTGTAFSTQYSETHSTGDLAVNVQQGQVEIADRHAQLTTLAAGQQGSFSDAVPRVVPILPVDRGSVTAGMVNTFSWTAFDTASGYLFEFTFNPAGFAQANPTGPEAGTSSLPLRPGVFTETAGTVEFPVMVPTGVLPPSAQARWRVFPTNATGQVLPGAVASDASTVIVLGGRADVSTISPVAGAAIVEGRSNTFSWTSFPGAAGYLFEFTLNSSGFARANPSGPESPASTFRVMPGAFVDASGSVQITVPVPSGIAPAGTQVQWRIFPLDAAGQVVPNATASDASAFVLQ